LSICVGEVLWPRADHLMCKAVDIPGDPERKKTGAVRPKPYAVWVGSPRALTCSSPILIRISSTGPAFSAPRRHQWAPLLTVGAPRPRLMRPHPASSPRTPSPPTERCWQACEPQAVREVRISGRGLTRVSFFVPANDLE
jgi:hypothetical protein